MTGQERPLKRRVDVGRLQKAMKDQRNFLRWMQRRYLEADPDQSSAFGTGAELLDEIRTELMAGGYDAGEEEVFTPRAPAGVAELLELEIRRPNPYAGRRRDEFIFVDEDSI